MSNLKLIFHSCTNENLHNSKSQSPKIAVVYMRATMSLSPAPGAA